MRALAPCAAPSAVVKRRARGVSALAPSRPRSHAVATAVSGEAAREHQFESGGLVALAPVGWIESQPVGTQLLGFLLYHGALAATLYVACTAALPALTAAAPKAFSVLRALAPLQGLAFLAAGVSHFTLHHQARAAARVWPRR